MSRQQDNLSGSLFLGESAGESASGAKAFAAGDATLLWSPTRPDGERCGPADVPGDDNQTEPGQPRQHAAEQKPPPGKRPKARVQKPGLEDTSASVVRSKQRVADHGEVFTPAWLVEDMLDLVKDETERIDSRFLEPACGSGNFLTPVLLRKLAVVKRRYGRSDFERRHFALLAVMCIYGIELLADNIAECRANVLEILAEDLSLDDSDDLYRAAAYVLSQNIVHGDALAMKTCDGRPLTFAEWGYLGKGRFQRRDFRLEVLTRSSTFSGEGALFAHTVNHEIFLPTKTYPPMTMGKLAAALTQTTEESA